MNPMIVTLLLILLAIAILHWFNRDRCPKCAKKGMKWEELLGHISGYRHWVCYSCGWRQRVQGMGERPVRFEDGKFVEVPRPEPPPIR